MKMIAVFVSVAALLALIESAVVKHFVNKQCDKTDTFLQLFGTSLDECTEECDRRSRCTAIMFMQRMNHCSLKDDSSVGGIATYVSGLSGNEPHCMFLEKKDWISSNLGPCKENTCDDTDTCVSSERDPKDFSCLKSTCPSPPVVANAYLLSDIQTIGSTNRYMCKDGYRSFGIPSITCTSNGEWEKIVFRCEPMCKTPQTTYENAVLARIEYRGTSMFKREVIHFTCKQNYQALGPTATSTCRNGTWAFERVRCCENETYNEPWSGRCVFYTEPLENFDQFVKKCPGRGYTMTGFNAHLFRYLLDSHGVYNILMPQKKHYYKRMNNLTKCFESENISVGNRTFDELINYARSLNMTRDDCKSVTWWAPSEPNGGTEENCIMRKTNETGSPLYDIPCTNLTDLDIRGVCHWALPVI